MKKIFVILIITLLLTGCNGKENVTSNENTLSNSNVSNKVSDGEIGSNEVTLYLFYSSTCPHCHAEIEWLEKVKDEYPYLNIVKYEASENYEKYEKVVQDMNINDYHVPLTIIGKDYYIGYNESKNDYFIKLIEDYSKVKHCDMVSNILENKNLEICK